MQQVPPDYLPETPTDDTVPRPVPGSPKLSAEGCVPSHYPIPSNDRQAHTPSRSLPSCEGNGRSQNLPNYAAGLDVSAPTVHLPASNGPTMNLYGNKAETSVAGHLSATCHPQRHPAHVPDKECCVFFLPANRRYALYNRPSAKISHNRLLPMHKLLPDNRQAPIRRKPIPHIPAASYTDGIHTRRP